MADESNNHDSGPIAGQTSGSGPPDRSDDGEPGRPRGKDEIDPELLALPRPRARMGPVLAVSVVVFCAYLMASLADDLRFSRQPAEPGETSPAEVLERGESTFIEHHVLMRAVPDRSFAMLVSHSEADPGHRMAPVQGTDGRLWLMIGGSVWTAGLHYDEIYSGRLRQLADLPFAGDLREHVDRRPPEPRFVTAEVVTRAIADGASTLVEPGGDTVPVSGDTRVHAYETVADQANVQVFPTERHGTPQAWARALFELGPAALDVPTNTGPDGPWTFVATLPGGARAVRDKLDAAGLGSARVEPVKRVHDAKWSDLLAAGGLRTAEGEPVPWSSVEWLAVDVKRSIPAGAIVLLTEETPEAYWYVLSLFVILGASGLLFLWGLIRIVLRMSAERGAASETAADATDPAAEANPPPGSPSSRSPSSTE